MTTYVPITPLPFQFTATLDGTPYTIIVTWNVSAQRNYINVYDQSGSLVVSTPLITSPPTYGINLIGGYFKTSTLVFRNATQQFEVSP